MKQLFAFATLLFLALIVKGQNLTEKFEERLTTPPGYVCYRTTSKIKIDGKLNEKDWQQAPSTAPFVDISGDGFPIPIMSTTAKMLWDDDYLYISAILDEKDIKATLKQRDTIIYHNNDFEVFIDPDGDGLNYFEIENNAYGTIMDLIMDKPYRSGGQFMMQWDCPGLKLAIGLNGTLNNSKDTDKNWIVEMAIPQRAIKMSFDNPLKANKYMRMNFSRVQWLKKEHEENWVWAPTGKIDIHMPERWGFVYLSSNKVDGAKEQFVYPYNMEAYKLLWTMFYAQQDNYSRKKNYIRNVKDFHFEPSELDVLPNDAKLAVEATSNSFIVSVILPNEHVKYTVNNDGRFSVDKIAPREVKNWVWSRVDKNKSDAEYKEWFALLKECGISAVLFEGYSEKHYKLCKEAGLEAHYWKWTLNRREVMDTHPEWFAVNRKGESSYDKPAYVDYYRFLCPNREGVAEYLAADYLKEANLPYVDGVHLDYVRFPDVVLPVSLWKNYGIKQTEELPEYDYCYCEVCQEKFKAQTGVNPLDIEFPMQSQSWLNFRYDAVTNVVDKITEAVKKENKYISGAVFPGPTMARNMVRQDWGNWSIDAYFPMIYNGFYYEGPQWIGRSVKESVQTVNGRADIYAGIMFPDIKDNFEQALDEAYDNGASGVSFFDGPSEEYLRRLKKYLDDKGYVVSKK